jgi:hypothetical protein
VLTLKTLDIGLHLAEVATAGVVWSTVTSARPLWEWAECRLTTECSGRRCAPPLMLSVRSALDCSFGPRQEVTWTYVLFPSSPHGILK